MAPTHRLRNVVLSGSLVLGAGLGAVGLAGVAGAAGPTTTTSTASSTTTTPCPQDANRADAPRAGHEVPLAGSDLAKATSAAEAAVPGASVVRAETGAAGTYEVHMKKVDGTFVTVKLDSTFTETAVTTGFAGHRGAGPGPRGERPATTLDGANAPTGSNRH